MKCCSDCLKGFGGNPYSPVSTSEEPIQGTNYTNFFKGVFQRDGSCCKDSELVEYARLWLIDIKKEVNKNRNFASKFVKDLSNLGQINQYIKTNKQMLLKSNKISAHDLDEFQEQIDDFSLGVFDIQNSLINYHKELESCYFYVYTLRANSLCLRCSGNGSEYWDKERKRYKLRKDICHEFVKQCSAVFSFSAEFNTFYLRFTLIAAAASGISQNSTKSKGINHYDLHKLRTCGVSRHTCDIIHFCSFLSLHKEYEDFEGEFSILDLGSIVSHRLITTNNPTRLLVDNNQTQLNKSEFEVADVSYGMVYGHNDGVELEGEFASLGLINASFLTEYVLNITQSMEGLIMTFHRPFILLFVKLIT